MQSLMQYLFKLIWGFIVELDWDSYSKHFICDWLHIFNVHFWLQCWMIWSNRKLIHIQPYYFMLNNINPCKTTIQKYLVNPYDTKLLIHIIFNHDQSISNHINGYESIWNHINPYLSSLIRWNTYESLSKHINS